MIEPTLFGAVWITVSLIVGLILLGIAFTLDSERWLVIAGCWAFFALFSGMSWGIHVGARWDAAHPQHEVRR